MSAPSRDDLAQLYFEPSVKTAEIDESAVKTGVFENPASET